MKRNNLESLDSKAELSCFEHFKPGCPSFDSVIHLHLCNIPDFCTTQKSELFKKILECVLHVNIRSNISQIFSLPAPKSKFELQNFLQ